MDYETEELYRSDENRYSGLEAVEKSCKATGVVETVTKY